MLLMTLLLLQAILSMRPPQRERYDLEKVQQNQCGFASMVSLAIPRGEVVLWVD